MSHKAVEFFFDVGSPTAYLAWTQLPAIAKEAGASIVWRPMLLGAWSKPQASRHTLRNIIGDQSCAHSYDLRIGAAMHISP